MRGSRQWRQCLRKRVRQCGQRPRKRNPCNYHRYRRQKRSVFCGSRATGGVDFDGSPVSETDEEDLTDPIPTVTEYHQIWDHDDFLRNRYLALSSADAESAYFQSDVLSDNVAEEVVSDRTEIWPNGNPMWATDPPSPIQLRLPPFPDPYCVIASLADTPEETPDVAPSDVPSVPRLRALWENQWGATDVPSYSEGNTVYYNRRLFSSDTRSGDQDEHSHDVTHYVDDVAPFPGARTRPPFVDNSEEESDDEPRSLSGYLGHLLSITRMTFSLMTMIDLLVMLRSRQSRPTLTPNSTDRRVIDSLKNQTSNAIPLLRASRRRRLLLRLLTLRRLTLRK